MWLVEIIFSTKVIGANFLALVLGGDDDDDDDTFVGGTVVVATWNTEGAANPREI